MTRRRKTLILTIAGILSYLAVEALLPARYQPTARLCGAMIDGYQTVGSPMMKQSGVRCKYTPSCSHYAEEAIAHYGTVHGGLLTAGRLFRCSPWGGEGYDPAVREARYVRPVQDAAPPQVEPKTETQDETPEERQRRLNEEAAKKFQEEFEKAMQEGGAEAAAGCAVCGVGFVVMIIASIVSFVVIILVMVWVYKDAKARGDSNAVLWLVLLFFLHWVGLVVYIVARPKGDLAPCPNCKNSRMTTLAKCPHCGDESPGKA